MGIVKYFSNSFNLLRELNEAKCLAEGVAHGMHPVSDADMIDFIT